jgi:hypothetical protein
VSLAVIGAIAGVILALIAKLKWDAHRLKQAGRRDREELAELYTKAIKDAKANSIKAQDNFSKNYADYLAKYPPKRRPGSGDGDGSKK